MHKKRHFRNEKGAIDLASIMVGIIVIGLIGGVIAATVFAVIPWAQDQAAKQQLSAVATAQNAYAGLTVAGASTIALTKTEADLDPNANYGDLQQLGAENLLTIETNPDKPWVSADGKLCTNKTADGFEAAIQSASSNVFKFEDGQIRRATGEELNTTCLGVLDTTAPPAENDDPLMEFEFNCPVSTIPAIPAAGFTGTTTWTVGGVTETGTETAFNRTLPANTVATLKLEGNFNPTITSTRTDQTSRDCLRKVTRWGATGQTNATEAFKNYVNLTHVATPPATLNNMSGMFYNAASFNSPANNWDTSNVTDMSFMFAYDLGGEGSSNYCEPDYEAPGCTPRPPVRFNQNINNWDVSNVTDMKYMFYQSARYNQPLNNWNTRSVTDLAGTFYGATSFNQNINNWDVSNVTDLASTFRQATSFNQPLNNWDVTNVTSLQWTFMLAENFNQHLDNWTTTNITDLTGTFESAERFNGRVNNWDTSKVENFNQVFSHAKAFNQPLNNWDVSKAVWYQAEMFNGATSFNQNINNWDVSKWNSSSNLFAGATSFNQPLDQWDTSGWKSAGGMFMNATSFNQNINNWDTGNFVNTDYMFMNATSYNQPLNGWNTGKIKNMRNMFRDATSFNQPLNNWNTSNVTGLEYLLHGATSFNQDISMWNVTKVTDGDRIGYHGTNSPFG